MYFFETYTLVSPKDLLHYVNEMEVPRRGYAARNHGSWIMTIYICIFIHSLQQLWKPYGKAGYLDVHDTRPKFKLDFFRGVFGI